MPPQVTVLDAFKDKLTTRQGSWKDISTTSPTWVRGGAAAELGLD